MDRGIPTGTVLAEMRECDPPVQYLVGTPKGRLSRLEKQLLAKPWQEALEPICRAMQSAAARQSESVRLLRLEYIGTAGTRGCRTARPCCTGRRRLRSGRSLGHSKERRLPRKPSLSSYLRDSRIARGLSVADLAARVGVSQVSIYYWEGGRVRPRAANLSALCKALKLPIKRAREIAAD
jgi:DNA-binding XRE family transcriptional regulator